MATCDKCRKEVFVRFLVGSTKLCEPCYGPRLNKPKVYGPTPGYAFKPYYHAKLGYVTSSKQEERLCREKGVSFLADYKKASKEARYYKKHKEEWTAENYAKSGIKYVAGSNTRYDEQRGEFYKPCE